MAEGAPRVERDGDVVTITMVRPAKRNALSREHLTQLLAAFREVGESDATGIVLAAEGPVFSAGEPLDPCQIVRSPPSICQKYSSANEQKGPGPSLLKNMERSVCWAWS